MKGGRSLLPPGLTGKNILLGVTGSIAAYKAAEWVRAMVKEEAQVSVVLTKAAEKFISSLTFAALSGNRVYSHMFEEDPDGVMAHINLAREADIILIAPATAQTIFRLATGSADDLLSTVVLASTKPVIICPAMNSNMLAHPATNNSLTLLKGFGYHIVEPGSGSLACGEVGDGRLVEWDNARELLLSLNEPDDFLNKRILITAGPTRESLDPARFISNRSSGKMGFALARTAIRRGADVTLITGPVNLPDPPQAKMVHVSSTSDMEAAVMKEAENAHIIIKAAAVADYRPVEFSKHKLKKTSGIPHITLEENTDILARLGRERRQEQILVGFAAESRDHEQEGRRKLEAKNVDLMVVNDILGTDTGFDVDTNQVTLLDTRGCKQLPLVSKESTANLILDHIRALRSV